MKRIVEKDKQVISNIQELVDATFQSWGPHGATCTTKDRRIHGNPLATRLKVEQVVRMCNIENYLRFQARRQDIVDDVSADGRAMTNDWDIKTRRVKNHSKEPLNKDINECWLWHSVNEKAVVGSSASAMFGRGIYFAESVLKADELSQEDCRGWIPVMLSRVVLGRVNYCDALHPHSMATAFEESVKSGRFHAVLGDREKIKGSFREFVVFDSDQVYPEYIVWYSRTPPLRRL